MVNRITIWLISFCLGALSAAFWPRLPTNIELTILLIALCISCLLLILLSLHSKHINNTLFTLNAKAGKGIYYGCLVLSGCVIGALMEASVGYLHYAWQLPNDKIQKEITIRARVLKGGCIPLGNIQTEHASTCEKNYKYVVKFIALEPTTLAGNLVHTDITTISHNQSDNRRRRLDRAKEIEKESTIQDEKDNETDKQTVSDAEFLIGKKGLLTMSTYTVIKDAEAEHYCLHNGDEFTAVVKLKPRYSTQNPVGFNKQKQLLVDNVHVTGYIKTLRSTSVTHKHSFRLRMATVLDDIDIQNRIWWQALLVGVRVNFDKTHWQLLQITGTGHLFSISGMHLGVVAAYTFVFCGIVLFVRSHLKILLQRVVVLLRIPDWRSCWPVYKQRCCGRQIPRKNNKLNAILSIKYRIAVIGIVWVTCGFYAALSGLALPVVRAYVLLSIASLFALFFIAYRPIHLATAMIAVCILLFPLSILSASFYLSVCAVLYIWLLTTRYRWQHQSRFKTLLILQLMLGVLMTPLTIIFFNSISVAGLAANIIAVPVITIILPPALLILLVLTVMQGVRASAINGNEVADKVYNLAERLFMYLDSTLSWLLSVLRYISQYDWAAIAINIDSRAAACLLVFMLVLIAPSWRYKKHALLVLTIPFLALYIPSNPKQWKLHALDAGQASAIVITKGDRAMVIDSGASFQNLAYTASSVLLPLLAKERVKAIDIIVHTHKDNDHAGGKAALASSPLAKKAKWFSPTKNCERGRVERWNELTIHFLWPKIGNTINNNDHSCVLKITDGQHSILLPGDIERTTEYAILNLPNSKENLKADILIAPHHGSKTSSTAVFLKSVAPKAAIFTQGFENRWQFPAKEVVTRYEALNIPYYMTSFHGYLTVTFPADLNTYPNHNTTGFTIHSQRFDLHQRWYLDARYPTHLQVGFQSQSFHTGSVGGILSK
ncbi:DNA internalization-related competence protein ComEC/Rec2 [Alteromonas sp. BMJM2]|uniref:DNA internalization-related competence protein ComEC/Rec2 n=1 Tax=Alteromonas sp. BMJM2 TaxID=2954241 RepID=UPI0022B3D088|nr:DNA internalization-related competence protein ComEC/Rec2 [Alteromonas sp. BMJM2]